MIHRWGAFSVIDYKDARKLAAEVLLYDGLLIPTPMPWDEQRWISEGWDPARLEARLDQLGDIAIKANWDQTAQKAWNTKMADLHQDLKDINSDEAKQGYHMTRRVLVDQERRYRPAGVIAVEAFAAYQSEGEFQMHEQDRNQRSEEFNFLVAQRILIPNEEDSEESLKRALDVANREDFRQRRRRFHDFQRGIWAGLVPSDAADEIALLIKEYNETVRTSGRDFRVETAILTATIGAGAVAAAVAAAPALFGGIGIGILTGVQVATIGAAAAGAVLQIASFATGHKDPAEAAYPNPTGAMFHQIEEETGWKYRTSEVAGASRPA